MGDFTSRALYFLWAGPRRAAKVVSVLCSGSEVSWFSAERLLFLQLAPSWQQHETEDHLPRLHWCCQQIFWQTYTKSCSSAGHVLSLKLKRCVHVMEAAVLMMKCLLFQFKKGGPIIAVQVENDYGSFAKDEGYMLFLKEVTCSSHSHSWIHI